MRSTIIALCALSTAALLGFACGSPPADKTPPTDTASSSGGGSSSGGDSGTTPSTSSGGAGDAGSTAAGSSGLQPPAPAGFDGLSADKKLEVMMTKVVPNVGKMFKEHDGKKFDKFGCKTCHGDVKAKSKDDPKKVLPKLKLSGDGADKLAKSKPAMMKFMNEKVLPGMADALGEKAASKPMDKDAKDGFACSGCHQVD